MTATNAVSITTPVGRIVQGSVSVAQEKNMEGQPLVDKQGKPKKKWYFGIAIPKTPGQHWAREAWGLPIWNTGHTGFPGGQAGREDFAWKITDGDSEKPNKQNRIPKNQPGFAGNWILRFSTEYAPKCYNNNGTSPMDPAAIKTGYFVQVNFTCAPNNDANRNPGIYLNPNLVAFQAYGEEISFGPDPTAVGFGTAPLPPGASATPVGGMAATGAASPPPPSTAAAPAPQGTPPPPAVPVTPSSTIIPAAGTQAPPPPPGAAPAPAPAKVLTMTPKAAGVTAEAYRSAGWTDQQMIDGGVAVWV